MVPNFDGLFIAIAALVIGGTIGAIYFGNQLLHLFGVL